MKYSSVSVTVGFFFLLLLGISDLLSLGYETIEVGTFVDLTSRQITPKGPHYLLEHYQIHGGGKCEIQSLYGLNANLTLVALNQTVFGSTKKLWVNASGKCLDEVHRSFYLFSGVGLIVPFLAFLLFLILFGIPPALCPSHEHSIGIIDDPSSSSQHSPCQHPPHHKTYSRMRYSNALIFGKEVLENLKCREKKKFS
jgi:hypothetical protein